MPASGELTIRLFTPDDLPAVRWLHDRTPPAGQIASRPLPWPDVLERIPESFVGFWLAFEGGDDNHLVGMVGLENASGAAAMVPLPDFVRGSDRLARLEYARVAPERQRRGIGRALAETAIETARGLGYSGIVLDTTTAQEGAIAFYRSLGFREVGRTPLERWTLVWLELEL